MPLDLSSDGFEALVGRELDALPAGMTDGIENLAFIVEDEADGEDLLGRYDGVDLTQHGQCGFGEMPDRIMVFRLPHLAVARPLEELRDEVRTTLVHEIGHCFGIDEERLHKLGRA